MKIGKLLVMATALGGLTLGCGDDSNPGGSGSESSGSETGSTGPGPGTTMQADDSGTTTTTGSGSAEGSESSSSGEPPPVEVTVEGEVVDFVAMGTPIADAEISIFDDASITTTADADGLFSIEPLLAETTALFVVNPNVDYWGAIIPIEIGTDPLQEDEQLAQIPSAFVDQQIMLLEPQLMMAGTMPDLDQAIMIVRLINNTAVGEGPTTVEMSPAPAPGTFYAPDAMGAPVLDQNTIEFNLLPVVVFFNVPDSAPGEISFTATHPTRECEVLFPELPTLGQHITLVDIRCLTPA